MLRPIRAFTLVELLVVVSIIVVLIALLVPAMEGAIEQSRRAVCGAHQKHIGTMVFSYTSDNKGDFFIALQRTKPFYFGPQSAQNSTAFNEIGDRDVDWLAAMSSVGLFSRSKDPAQYNLQVPSKVWTCPNVLLPAFWINSTHALVHFQYMGGFTKWQTRNAGGARVVIESASPVKISTSRPGWMVLSELNGIPNYYAIPTEWWGSSNMTSVGVPPHADSPNPWPAGGNQMYVDGSVEWVPFHKMSFVHAYNPHAYFFYQQDLGGLVVPENMKATAWMRKSR